MHGDGSYEPSHSDAHYPTESRMRAFGRCIGSREPWYVESSFFAGGRYDMTARACILGLLTLTSLLHVAVEAQAQTIKADHTTVDVTAIPAATVTAAQALRMSFSHASVGGNIWSGLQNLASDPTYALPNWKDNSRGNPGWQAKVTDFETWVAAHLDEFDVFQNKFCYIDQDAVFATYRDSMTKLAAAHPAKTFVWWTMPIMVDDAANSLRQSFNQQVRAHCAANDLPLYDIADIESHEADGTAVTNSGVESMDSDQSSDGGHLSALGISRTAAAEWALMAQIAGWRPALSDPGNPSSTNAHNPTDQDSGCSMTPRSSLGSRWALLGLLSALGLVLGQRRRIG